MAIPTTLFSNSSGLALMRRHTGTDEWFFVRWLDVGTDVHVSYPGATQWQYAVWLVLGVSGPAIDAFVPNKEVGITVLEVSK